MPPILSKPAQSKKVRKYKPEEVNLDNLAAKCRQILHRTPFTWQLEIARSVLCGEDVVVDVGTGSGKTMCFALPLLQDDTDIVVIVSPLTALMTDQANSAVIPTVAVCAETIARIGAKKLYEDIVEGKYRQVIVSPEIMISDSLRKGVLSKEAFQSKIRAVCIDEAHCMSLWGGSFRPDYTGLGALRGRFSRSVPFVVASATLPNHVLDDIKRQLRLEKSVNIVSVSNARPNVALSVRGMEFSEESKADLRFLIPKGATKAEDIPITLVYCNQRTTTEDGADHLRDWAEDCGISRECIAFYHARLGEKRKRELEEMLRKGEIRILICTDAVGMGCDMRNIFRVVLWGLPPSFCALVQRAGRAGRDFTTLGEAVLIVPKSAIRKGVTEENIIADLSAMTSDNRSEAENRSDETERVLLGEVDIEFPVGTSAAQVLSGEGTRIQASDATDISEPDDEPTAQPQRKKIFNRQSNEIEVRFLSMYVTTKACRRKVWDRFFENEKKLPLEFPTNTSYQRLPSTRCCDNCEPRLFEVERITVARVPGLKRGRKRQISTEEIKAVCDGLEEWRDSELVDEFYEGVQSISGATILGDDIVQKVANCGERIGTYADLRRHAHWRIGHDVETNGPSRWGSMLLDQLSTIYKELDARSEVKQREEAASTLWTVLTPENFYYTATHKDEDTIPTATSSNTTSAEGSSQRGRKKRRGRKKT